jgi:large subunit ribosomal protein L24
MAERMPFVRGDLVRVTAGKDRERLGKGIEKRGEVNKVFAKTGRVTVSQINLVKRHTRPNPQKGQQGGIVDREATIHHSNLQLICPSCRKPTRIGYRRAATGEGSSKKFERVRYCKLCEAGLGEARK